LLSTLISKKIYSHTKTTKDTKKNKNETNIYGKIFQGICNFNVVEVLLLK